MFPAYNDKGRYKEWAEKVKKYNLFKRQSHGWIAKEPNA